MDFHFLYQSDWSFRDVAHSNWCRASDSRAHCTRAKSACPRPLALVWSSPCWMRVTVRTATVETTMKMRPPSATARPMQPNEALIRYLVVVAAVAVAVVAVVAVFVADFCWRWSRRRRTRAAWARRGRRAWTWLAVECWFGRRTRRRRSIARPVWTGWTRRASSWRVACAHPVRWACHRRRARRRRAHAATGCCVRQGRAPCTPRWRCGRRLRTRLLLSTSHRRCCQNWAAAAAVDCHWSCRRAASCVVDAADRHAGCFCCSCDARGDAWLSSGREKSRRLWLVVVVVERRSQRAQLSVHNCAYAWFGRWIDDDVGVEMERKEAISGDVAASAWSFPRVDLLQHKS